MEITNVENKINVTLSESDMISIQYGHTLVTENKNTKVTIKLAKGD